MGIVKENTLDSKVKRCNYCSHKNTIAFNDIKLAPRSGFYNENGGYYYFECKHCKKTNFIPKRIVRKLTLKAKRG